MLYPIDEQSHSNTINISPIGSMYGIYANIWGILMVNVTIYSIHGSYGLEPMENLWNMATYFPGSVGLVAYLTTRPRFVPQSGGVRETGKRHVFFLKTGR